MLAEYPLRLMASCKVVRFSSPGFTFPSSSKTRMMEGTLRLGCSLRSIQEDQGLGNQQRATQMQESVQQFTNAMNALIPRLCGMETQVVPAGYDVIEEV